MTDKSSTILIIILVLIAVALGYAAFQQLPDKQVSDKGSAIPSERKLPGDASLGAPAAQTNLPPDELNMSLEEKERFVLNPPTEDSSREDKDLHLRIAQSIAQAAPYLDITNCERGDPLVFKVKAGEEFSVKNEDSLDHTISVGNNSFLIPAHGEKTILPEFYKGPGVYGYGCDASLKEVGMIWVTQ